MGKIVFGLLTVLLSTAAMASEQYICSAELPQGEAQVIVQNDLSVGQQIYLRFYHRASNQTYQGTLAVTASQNNDFLAQGRIHAFEPNPSIEVSLTGTLDPNNNETQTLQLYAGSNDQVDKRIEYGYGNVLRCHKQ